MLPQLKPLTAGDILDQAIRIYRENFVRLITIVAIVTLPVLIVQSLAFGLVLPFSSDFQTIPQFNPATSVAASCITVMVTFIGAIMTIFQMGALTSFVSERFLGRTLTVREAYGNAFRHWVALFFSTLLLGVAVGVLVAVLVSVFIVPLVLAAGAGASGSDVAAILAGVAGLVLCVLFIPGLLGILYLYTRWSFYIQAIMIENYNSTGSLGRSWKLVKGSFWRVLGFVILLYLLSLVLTFGLFGAVSVGAFFLPSPAIRFIVQSLASGLIAVFIQPLQYATLTVLYYDLRIRKEGFDLQMQLQDSSDLPSSRSRPHRTF